MNLLLNRFLGTDERSLEAVDRGRASRCLPNAYLASQLALVGDDDILSGSREKIHLLVDMVREFGIDEGTTAYRPELDAFIRGFV